MDAQQRQRDRFPPGIVRHGEEIKLPLPKQAVAVVREVKVEMFLSRDNVDVTGREGEKMFVGAREC